MTPDFDPYETLQVIPTADPEVIQAAFRTLARKHHPDMGGSEETMAVLNEAWSILRDRRRRTRYDRQRATAAAVQAAKTEQPSTAAPVTAWQPPAWSPAAQPAASGAGAVLDFGRYQGRTLADLATRDPEYLEWLVRTRIGSRFRREVDNLLAATRPMATATANVSSPRRGFFNRR
jgi:curved DNA-binding protein CbpA